MVSFVCDTCQETLKKPKLDAHAQRCRNAQFSCIDCSTTFTGLSYRTHTSCISEAEKYQGKLFQGKKRPREEPKKTPNDTLKEIMTSTLTEKMTLSSWKSETVKKMLKADPNANKKQVKKLFERLVTFSNQKGQWTVQCE